MSTLTLAEFPFTRKNIGPHYIWAADLEIAMRFCADHELTMFFTDTPYQVAKLIGDRIKLVIYPHTVKTTRNKHLRVRDEGSADKKRAQDLMALLGAATGFNCTFQPKWNTNPRAHSQWLSPENLKATADDKYRS